MCNVTVRPSVRPSVCLFRLFSNLSIESATVSARRILNVTHQGAACDMASVVHFRPIVRRADIGLLVVILSLSLKTKEA